MTHSVVVKVVQISMGVVVIEVDELGLVCGFVVVLVLLLVE